MKNVFSFGSSFRVCLPCDLQLYKTKLGDPLRLSRRLSVIAGVVLAISQSFVYLAFALVVWYGLRQLDGDSKPLRDVVAIILVFGFGSYSIAEAIVLAPHMGKAVRSMRAVFKIVDNAQICGGNGDVKLEGVASISIKFEKVVFSYPMKSDVFVLRGMSCTVDPNTVVVVLGPVGCGKTTLLLLLLKFWEPMSGRILLNECSIQTLNSRWLRDQLGWLSTEPVMLEKSFKDNIKFAIEDATDDDIVAAARLTNVHDLIDSYPMKYDTQNISSCSLEFRTGQPTVNFVGSVRKVYQVFGRPVAVASLGDDVADLLKIVYRGWVLRSSPGKIVMFRWRVRSQLGAMKDQVDGQVGGHLNGEGRSFGCIPSGRHNRPGSHPFWEDLASDILFEAELRGGNPNEIADAEWARKTLAIGLLAHALLRLSHLVACLDK
ncbi:hypothetical protein CBR_g54359 [Chara braunii]|uniref:ABC transmembrane type-1 domain-containing protein n=1 Tax=Chara braunii TaxID=69332 RepID=A0A388MC09_CHABU|nr:hypothetical protein CBR_g54359 [Chara braunii]|eukprot:GBG92104.1 hypothetical protein CBR_g54359 [Chara braunii]